MTTVFPIGVGVPEFASSAPVLVSKKVTFQPAAGFGTVTVTVCFEITGAMSQLGGSHLESRYQPMMEWSFPSEPPRINADGLAETGLNPVMSTPRMNRAGPFSTSV